MASRGPAMVAGHSSAVTGAEQFSRALRETDRGLARELGQAGRAIGKRVVTVQKGKANLYSRQAAAAAKAISIQSTNTFSSKGGISLRLSSKRGFEFGAEFGARRYPQFPPWKGNQFQNGDFPDGIGYFFHPGIADQQDEILDLYMEAVRDAAKKAGIDMSSGPRAATAADVIGGQISQAAGSTFAV